MKLIQEDKLLQQAERLLGRPLYSYQKEFLKAGNDPSLKGRVVVKARQTGMSTVMCLEAAIHCLAMNGYVVMLISRKEKDAAALLERVRVILRRLGPSVYKEVVVRDTYTELMLSNGSWIMALSQDADAARSYTANMVYLDEAAYLTNAYELLAAISGATVRKGRTTFISTPNGMGDVFHETWLRREELGYWGIEIPWNHCPDLTPEIIETEKARLKTIGKSFEQEYLCKFDVKQSAIWTWKDLLECLSEDHKTRGGIRVLGYDPAKRRHSSGCLVLQIEKGKKEVIHMEDLKGMPYNQQGSRIIEMVGQFNLKKVYVDAFGVGDPVIDYLGPIKGKVEPLKLTKDDKINLMHYIKSEYEGGRFSVREHPLSRQLLDQLYSFDVDTGKFPEHNQAHGDIATALLLSWKEVGKTDILRPVDVSRTIRTGQNRRIDPGRWYMPDAA